MLCTFCHIPHSKTFEVPLWNSEEGEVRFSISGIKPLNKEKSIISSRVIMCLSCHDRAIGKGINLAHYNNSGYMGDHPVNRFYSAAGKGLAETKVIENRLVLREGMVECGSCHNPHSPDYKPFLFKPLNELCINCHERIDSGRHVMARYGMGDDHPVKGKPDPSRQGVDISCVSCHHPHLSITSEPLIKKNEICYRCHSIITTRP